MFVLRSLFWLSLAFIVIKPQVDLDAAALADRAMATGSEIARAQIASVECDTLACAGGQAMLSAVLAPLPPAAETAEATPADPAVPLPRRRPG
jgi:hypothetical protein